MFRVQRISRGVRSRSSRSRSVPKTKLASVPITFLDTVSAAAKFLLLLFTCTRSRTQPTYRSSASLVARASSEALSSVSRFLSVE